MADIAPYRNERIDEGGQGDPQYGVVRWDPLKSLWFIGMVVGWAVGGTLYFSWDALLLFFGTCALTLCGGHSLGMHRKLIHDSFQCPDWLERLGVYLGTLVGLGGPFTMMYTHDMRDWAQRQPACHAFFTHQGGFLRDAWWQLNCQLYLNQPPRFEFPANLEDSRFYLWLERTAMLQQLPWAVLLFALGGWGWVAWGICGRVAISMFGHWLIGHFAHNRGPRDWTVEGAAVQGHNIPWCGLITFGECWHNNHHAFPGSARLGLYRGQFDPGWLVLRALAAVGLVSDMRLPDDMPPRPELKPVLVSQDRPVRAVPL